MSLRISDTRGEAAVAEFLDKEFYPKFTENPRRTSDRDTQLSGIDITIDHKDKKGLLVDEKANIHYVNKGLPTFAFELSFLTTSGQLVEGWLYDKNKNTQYYLLSWIWALKDKDLSCEDITKVELILVERKAIIELLASLGLTRESAHRIGARLRKDGVPGAFYKDVRIPYYFYYTTHLTEKPINIVINKNALIRLATEHQIINRTID